MLYLYYAEIFYNQEKGTLIYLALMSNHVKKCFWYIKLLLFRVRVGIRCTSHLFISFHLVHFNTVYDSRSDAILKIQSKSVKNANLCSNGKYRTQLLTSKIFFKVISLWWANICYKYIVCLSMRSTFSECHRISPFYKEIENGRKGWLYDVMFRNWKN